MAGVSVGFVVGRRSMVAAGSAGALAGALLVGGAAAATAAPAQSTAPTVTVSGAAQFSAAGQTYSVSLDVRGTAAGGSGRCALSGGGLAATCTGISSVTRGTGTAADSATIVGTVRTSRGQNVAFRAVVTDRANPNGAGRDVISATVDGRTVQGTVTNGNLAVAGSTPTPNRAPVAQADAYTVAQNGTLLVPAPGVLSNDTDPDGDRLTVGSYTQPAHGTLTLNPDGSFTYGPTVGYTGPDSFTYTASDGRSTSAPATVAITVQSPAPRANPDVNTVSPGSPEASGNVLANDIGDSLTVQSAGDVEGAFGTLTINRDGSYVYRLTNAPGESSSDKFSYTAVDGQGRVSSSTLTIRIDVPATAAAAN